MHLKRMCILLFLHEMQSSTKFICSNVTFRAIVSLLIFCLGYLSIDIIGVLNYSTITVCCQFFMSVNICFTYVGLPMFCVVTWIAKSSFVKSLF